MTRMLFLITVTAILSVNPESDAALADRAQFPLHEQGNYYYLTLSTVPKEMQADLAATLRFVVPSLSSKPYLEDQIPAFVRGTNLLRLNIAGLGWETTYPYAVKKVYPYRPDLPRDTATPLVVCGLWFAANLLDPIETGDTQYQLLYGGKPPKSADEFLKFWGIQNEAEYVFGMIEAQSGVALEKVRLIENRPGAKRNYGWLTRDSAKIAGKTDPLENLPNKAQFDAQELIVGNPKWYGGKSGMLQAYLLADAKGNRQEKAPANIVEDHTRVRGGPEIRNFSGCVSCHLTGIQSPTSDQYKLFITSGARVGFLKKEDQQNVDRYLGSDVEKEITANNAAYADGIALVNGLDPKENALLYRKAVATYDAPVGLDQAARELYTTSAALRLALADYSRLYPDITGRLALMAQGQTMSRAQFVENFHLAQKAVALWSAK